MAEYALRLENSTDNRERLRKGDALALTPGPVSGARNGLRPDGGGEVTAVAGTMTVEVTPFRGWVDGGASDAQGGYPFILDATKTLTIADGDAVLPRTDTVVAEVRDNTYDASGATDARVRIVTGTPGSGAPTLPSSCVALRDVSVPAGMSAGTGGLSSSNMGTDRRSYIAALGGVVRVSGVTERDAMGARESQPVWRADTNVLQVYDGATWRTFGEAHAVPTYGERSGNTNASGEITVTHGLGATPASIQLTGHTGPSTAVWRVKGTPTSTSFVAEARVDTGAPFNGAVTFYGLAYPPA